MDRVFRGALLALIAALSCSVSVAQTGDTENFGELKVVSSKDYDELYHSLNAKTAQEAYENFVGEFINFDQSESIGASNSELDSLYSRRLRMLATEIQLPYNPIVRSFIDRYIKRKSTMDYVLGMGKYYFPIFEQVLYENNLPLELKMVPVIESALIPTAKSGAAAVGLWQIMLATGKAYGLEINTFVDERQDPRRSSEAACLFLKDLYDMYGDWTLVIAAYNCGPGNVNKAIRLAGGNVRTYWDIWEYLPSETRNYVPTYIGATYGYTFHKSHNLEPREISLPLSVDTLHINKMLHFDQISSTIDITTEELRALNPQYRIDIIPAIERKYTLILPSNRIGDFIDNQNTIYSKDKIYLEKYLSIDNFSAEEALKVADMIAPSGFSGKKVVYTVKSGDTLGHIGERYNVRAADIRKWNSMKNSNLRIGQKLTIYPR